MHSLAGKQRTAENIPFAVTARDWEKPMKRLVLFLLLAALTVSLASCSRGNVMPGDTSTGDGSAEVSVPESESEGIPPELYEAVPISDVLDLDACGAPAASGAWLHGGNQTRIVKTSHGIYCTYISGEPKVVQDNNMTHYVFVKIGDDGSCTQLYDGYYFTESNSPYIMADNDENVYVVCGGGTSPSEKKGLKSYIWKYDPSVGEVVEYTASFNYSAGGAYGYAMGFIDNSQGKIYLVNCGGDRKGYFCIIGFDLESCTYTAPYTFEISEGRHCYVFAFPDGNGGFSLIAQHDVSIAASGHSKNYFKRINYGASYVWDDLRLFSFSTGENDEIIYNGLLELAIADYDEESDQFPPQNTCAKNGDAFMDSDGNIHVIYQSSYQNAEPRICERHIIVNKELEIVYNEEITLDSDYTSSEIKMYETTEGVFYLFVMPRNLAMPEGYVPNDNPEYMGRWISNEKDCVMQIYRSEDGISFTKIYEKSLEGCRWYPQHITATQARNGSLIDNKLCALVAVEPSWKYVTIDFDMLEAMYKYDLLK